MQKLVIQKQNSTAHSHGIKAFESHKRLPVDIFVPVSRLWFARAAGMGEQRRSVAALEAGDMQAAAVAGSEDNLQDVTSAQ